MESCQKMELPSACEKLFELGVSELVADPFPGKVPTPLRAKDGEKLVQGSLALPTRIRRREPPGQGMPFVPVCSLVCMRTPAIGKVPGSRNLCRHRLYVRSLPCTDGSPFSRGLPGLRRSSSAFGEDRKCIT